MSGACLFKRERSVELYSVMRSSTEDGEFVISSEVSKSEMKSGTCIELILRKDMNDEVSVSRGCKLSLVITGR
jgi:hypothetical protein